MSREADSDDAARRPEPGGVTGPEPLPEWPSDASAGLAPIDQPDEPAGPGRRRGRVNFQDENTTPREPTLAEQRAHQQAQKQAIEDEQARLAAEAAAAKKRKRMLIGGGAVAGVAALIAVGYAVSGNDEAVEARCVDENNVVVDDSNCVTPASNSSSYAGGGGGFGFFPIFLGGGNRQYHYNYGGSGSIGQTATGGTTVAPKDATVRSATSGRTISRGGFGVSSSSGSGGGAKAGSSSGS